MKRLVHSFNGTVKGGRLALDNSKRFYALIPVFEGKRIVVTVGHVKKKRSNLQNAYYWAAVVEFPAQHFGYYPEEMHEAFKMMFLKKHELGKPDTVRSTTELGVSEFSEFIEKCRQWCAEQGIVIPNPDQLDLEEL